MKDVSRRSVLLAGGTGLATTALGLALPATAGAATPSTAPAAAPHAAAVDLGQPVVGGLLPKVSRSALKPRARWHRRATELQATSDTVLSFLDADSYANIDQGGVWYTGVTTDQATFETWIRTTATAAQTLMLGQIDSGGGTPYITMTDHVINVFWSTGGTGPHASCDTGATLADGQWHHLALVFDTGTVTFYRDGNPVGTAALDFSDYPDQTSPISAAGNFQLGPGFTTAGFVGEMWNVRVWNTARDAGDVRDNRWAALDPTTPGLTLLATLAAAGVGNALDPNSGGGTAGNCKVIATDVPSAAFALQCNSGAALISAQSPQPLTTDAATVEAWVTITAQSGPTGLFELAGDNLANRFAVTYDDTQLTAVWNSGPTASQKTTPLADGTWHHIGCVLDTGTVTFYIDGVAAGPATDLQLTTPVAITTLSVVGLGGVLGDGPQVAALNGELFDVRVWDTARTPSEIASFRYATLAAGEPDLVFLLQGTGPGQLHDAVNGAAPNLGSGTAVVGISAPDPTLPAQLWTYPLDGYTPVGPLWTSGGNVVCTTAGGTALAALDAQTQTVAWTLALPQPTGLTTVIPAAITADNTRIYFGTQTSDGTGTITNTSITAIDSSNGQVSWAFSFPQPGRLLTQPVIDIDGNVIVGMATPGTGDLDQFFETATFTVLDADAGTLVGNGLSQTVPAGVQTTRAVTASGVYYAAADYYSVLAEQQICRAFGFGVDIANPSVVWETNPLPGLITADPVLADGTLYLTVGGTVTALSAANGATLWTCTPSGSPVTSRPLLLGTTLFVGSTDGFLYAVDTTTHTVAWSVDTGSAIITDLVTEAGIVYFANQGDGADLPPAFVAIDSNNNGIGALSYDVPGGDTILYAGGAVAAGTVYFASSSTVYAVDMATQAREVQVTSQLIVEDYDFDNTAADGNPLGNNTSYRVTITLRDEDGVARARQALKVAVAADAISTLCLLGLDPDDLTNPTTLTTDGLWFETDNVGQLVLVVSAYDTGSPGQGTAPDGTPLGGVPNLACPPLVLWSTFLPTDEVVVAYPSQDTLATLANVQPDTATNGTAALQSARGYDGATTVLNSDVLNDPNGAVSDVATTIRNTIGQVGTPAASSGLTRTRIRGTNAVAAKLDPQGAAAATTRPWRPATDDPAATMFTAAFNDDGSVTYQGGVFDADPPKRSTGTPPSVGAELGSISDFFHRVVKGAEKVVKVAWHWTDNELHTVVHTLEATYTDVVATLEDAVTVVTGFLKTVVTDLNHVVEWLSHLFDWKTILANHDTLIGQVQHAIGTPTADHPDYGQLQQNPIATNDVGSLASGAADNVTAAGGTSVGPNVGSLNSSYGDPSTVWTSTGANPTACTWMQQKTNENRAKASLPNGVAAPAAAAVTDVSDLWPALHAAVKSALQQADFANLTPRVHTAFTGLLDSFKDPKSLLSTGIDDLLAPLQTLGKDVLNLLDAVAGDIANLVTGVLAAALDQLVNTALNIPFVSDLYHAVTGEQLSILNLVCLIAAVPATIVTDILDPAPIAAPNPGKRTPPPKAPAVTPPTTPSTSPSATASSPTPSSPTSSATQTTTPPTTTPTKSTMAAPSLAPGTPTPAATPTPTAAADRTAARAAQTTSAAPAVPASPAAAAATAAQQASTAQNLLAIGTFAVQVAAAGLDAASLDAAINDPLGENTVLGRIDYAIDLTALALALSTAIVSSNNNGTPFVKHDWVFWFIQAVPLAINGARLLEPDSDGPPDDPADGGIEQILLDTVYGLGLAIVSAVYAGEYQGSYLTGNNIPGLALVANLLSNATLLGEILILLLGADDWGQVVIAGKAVLAFVAATTGVFCNLDLTGGGQ